MATPPDSGGSREPLNVCGVEVDFPFRPYSCQLVYMEKVVESLQRGVNAILESPTGTGKTLCLLCAALGWREDFIRKQRGLVAAECGGEGANGCRGEVDAWDSTPSGSQGGVVVPKIIYASRTHSQLSQVIHELKNTKYRPRMAIIGSREQLCIHPEVSKKESNFEKVHSCRAKVQSNSCLYSRNVDVKRLKTRDSVMDIEDLVLAGTKQRMCPYYLAREMQTEADIIFMPYNYILDIKTRKMHNINVQGTIIILDEAHNIERVCEDSASFDLTSSDISLCLSDVDTILKAKKEELELSVDEKEISDDFQDFINLKAVLISLEKKMDELELSTSSKGVVKPGEFMLEFLAGVGVTPDNFQILQSQCGRAISWLTADSRSFRNGNNIEKFLDAIFVVFSSSGRGPTHSSTHSYKVFMKAEDARSKKRSDMWTAPAPESSSKRETRTLSYWCFSPGHAMRDLTAQGVRSVILTSGTLSPLNSFSSELHIDFPIQYEGPHVISKEQVWVGVVSRGCDGVPLNSSYENRSTASYQSSLGNTIVNFARIVPQGLLVFFPSYPVMHSCINHWRENGILQRMEQFKPYYQEPRKKGDFNPTMDAFYEAINDPKKDGAIFFAVCRGKVSEGLDFANNNGRAVIITGLPYPPRMDPKVDLKMKHLEEAHQTTPHSVKVLGGQEWYRQQSSRAVNQAVGRVIRHKHDYGAILLCDERFAYRRTIEQLPKWVRPFVQTYEKFGLVQRDLTQFFSTAERQFGSMAPKRSVGESVKRGSEGETSGGRGPIVVKENPAWRGRMLDLQDAGQVETHLASKAPEASLRKLEKMKSVPGRSLLGSLEQVEADGSSRRKGVTLYRQTRLKAGPGPSLSQSILSADHSSTQSSAEGSRVRVRPKKMLVVSKRHQVKKMEGIVGFIDEMKANLSDHAFSSFKTALALYKEKQDIYAFIESLKDIFNQAAHHLLLKKLHSFVLEKHKETFSLFYHEFTGSELEPPCGPSAPHQLHERKRRAFESKEQPRTKSKKLEKASSEEKSCHLRTGTLLDSLSHLNHGQGHLNS